MKEREEMREGWEIIFKVKDCSASGNLKLKCNASIYFRNFKTRSWIYT